MGGRQAGRYLAGDTQRVIDGKWALFEAILNTPEGSQAGTQTAAQPLPQPPAPASQAGASGQAGDRSDSDICALTQTAWQARPDRIIVKELDEVLRGRTAGEVTALINSELASLGVPEEVVAQAPSEMDAVRQAFAWAQPGDLLILLLHTQRKAALAFLKDLEARGWQAGEALEA